MREKKQSIVIMCVLERYTTIVSFFVRLRFEYKAHLVPKPFMH